MTSSSQNVSKPASSTSTSIEVQSGLIKTINGFQLQGNTATKSEKVEGKLLTITVTFPPGASDEQKTARLNNFKTTKLAKIAIDLGVGNPDKDVKAVRFVEDKGKVITQQQLKGKDSTFKTLDKTYFDNKRAQIAALKDLNEKEGQLKMLSNLEDVVKTVNSEWQKIFKPVATGTELPELDESESEEEVESEPELLNKQQQVILPKGYEWLSIKGRNVQKKGDNEFSLNYKGKDIELQIGPEMNHGEYDAVRKNLKQQGKDTDTKFCSLSIKNGFTNVIYKNDDGKIRIYQGDIAQGEALIYQEFDSLDIAMKNFVEKPEIAKFEYISRLISLRGIINNLPSGKSTKEDKEGLIDTIKFRFANVNIPKEHQVFIDRILNLKEPFNKEKDLKKLNDMISKSLQDVSAKEQKVG